MLTNFFSKSKPITILIVFVFFLGLLTISFFNKHTQGTFLEIAALFLFLLILVVFITAKNNLSFDNLYGLLIFILLLGMFPVIFKLNTVFYNNLVLLFFLRKVYSLQSASKTTNKLFDSGLWMGVSFIIEPFSAVFSPLIYLSVFLHQHLTFQKIIIPIIGFLTAVFLFFTYCFWFDKTVVFWNLFYLFTNYDLSFYSSNIYLIPLSVISLVCLVSLLIKTPRALAIKNDFRRNWILVIFNFVCAILLIILVKERNGSELLYAFFPIAIIIANLIEIYEEKWFSSFFLALFIGASILMNFI